VKDWQTTIIIGLTFGGIITWFFYSRVRLAQVEAQAKEAELAQARHEKQRLEAELKLLQAQIEPHFLYNTLANIRSLVDTRPSAAAAMLEDLNKYLRTSLTRSRDVQVTLGQEVEMLRSYLDILKVRMGDRMRYAIEIGEGLENVPLPPMLLQPLVENAVKHGLEPKVDGGTIDIKINGNEDILRVVVADTGMGLSSVNGEGVGLGNVRSRLKSIYGDGARLEISAGPHGGVMAVIEVPRRE
jgi:sensor histidine kinase YesM